MSIGIGIIIFLVSFIALIAQFFVYMALGVSLSFAGTNIGGLAWFFVGLMILTGVIGILAPISAFIQQITKKKGVGNRILIIGIAITLVGYVLLMALGGVEKSKTAKIPEFSSTVSKTEQNEQLFKKEYIKNYLLLDQIEVTEGYGQFDMPGYDEKKPVIKGKIKNSGDKILREVEITSYFLDGEGNRIFEKDYHPILVTEYGLGDNEPLKPNYIREFGYVVDGVPSEWAGKIEIEITDIDFQE